VPKTKTPLRGGAGANIFVLSGRLEELAYNCVAYNCVAYKIGSTKKKKVTQRKRNIYKIYI